jgi:uncharacterized iron-regulated membrane protein
LWIGLGVGILATILGLSGSVIVFRSGIERALNHAIESVAPEGAELPLDDLAARIRTTLPAARVEFVQLPEDSRASIRFFVHLSSKRNEDVILDPYTGAILSVGERRIGWLDWFVTLHTSLFLGRAGRIIEGVAAILLFLLCATGILVWWPGRRFWRRNLAFSTKVGPRRLAIDAHKAIGFWALFLLTLFAVTGISFTWGRQVSNFIYWVTGSARPKEVLQPDWRQTARLLPLDAYVDAAQRALPGGRPTWVEVPDEGKRPASVGVHLPGDLREEGSDNVVYLDRNTAATLRVDRFSDEPIGVRIVDSFSTLHFGEFGGLSIKILWSFFGLVPGLLFFTGFWQWWHRVGVKALRKVQT